jgi:hypothetical protein
MNAIISTLYRDLTCAIAAAVITLIASLSFVQATSLPPGARATGSDPVVHQSLHA